MQITIRRLKESDRDHWEELWKNYLDFYRAKIAEDVTDNSFQSLCNNNDMIGLIAANSEGRVIGFIHFIFHASTWSKNDYCYINDLYIHPDYRGEDIANMLFKAVYEYADKRCVSRVYWLTQEYNGKARSLYDTFAKRSSFVVYMRI